MGWQGIRWRSRCIRHLTRTDGLFGSLKGRHVYSFDAEGRLAQTSDRHLAVTTLLYDDQGRLITVQDPYDRTLTLTYTSPISASLLTQVTDR